MGQAVVQEDMMKTGLKGLWLLLSLSLLLGLARPAQAQSPEPADPPAKVGRVAEVIGDAWLFDPETREWTRVLRNQTVGEGDRLRTDERSRISLRIGSTSLWMDERSDLEFAQLDEGRVLLQLDKGDIGLRLRSPETAGDYRVQTREGLILPEREGLYRAEQLDRGSRAFVWNGRLRFESSRGSDIPPVFLQGGEQAEFWWTGNGPRVERQRIEPDAFGDWMVAQNRSEGEFASSQNYVSTEMTGAEDLDRNGRWEQSGDYGAVWIPLQVAPDWAPYRDGRWVWTRNWGWSWVDDAPWGFAPFHYGRWVMWRGRWCWAPGRYVARPVYAPALVAWVGGSVSVGVVVGGRPPPPRYGWYPLAPREAYVPHYRHTPVYGRRINVDNDPVTVRRPGPRPNNREIPGAISYLPGQGGPVRPMPVGEARPAKPLPAPPGRGELGGQLPQRPGLDAPAPRPPVADMPWRSEQRPGRREREPGREVGREPGRDRDQAQPRPVMPQPAAGAGVPVAPQQPSAQLPQAPQEPREFPGRGGRGRDRDAEREPVRAGPGIGAPAPAIPAAPVIAPVNPVQQLPAPTTAESPRRERGFDRERFQERGERGERGFERPLPGRPAELRGVEPRAAERLPERTRPVEAPQMPQAPRLPEVRAPQAPQPQAQPSPRPERSEDRGPPRGRRGGERQDPPAER